MREPPGHKDVSSPAAARLELARAAFPGDEVGLDPHARTVDLLRAEQLADPVFLVGADEFCGFSTGRSPTRCSSSPGSPSRPVPASRASGSTACSSASRRPERVVFFDPEPNPAASREIRGIAAAGEPLDGLVPPAVAVLIERLGLYRRP